MLYASAFCRALPSCRRQKPPCPLLIASHQRQGKSYNKAVIPVVLTVFPGIMLLAYLGLQKWMFIFVPLALVPFLLFARKSH